MVFDELSYTELLGAQEVLVGYIIGDRAALATELLKPQEIEEIVFDVVPDETRKGHTWGRKIYDDGRVYTHRWIAKNVKDINKAFNEAKDSFRRRFDKKKQWFTADGKLISAYDHDRRVRQGVTGDTLSIVKRFSERQWGAILSKIQVKTAEFVKDTQDENKIAKIKEDLRVKRNELSRVQRQITNRERARRIIDNWDEKVVTGWPNKRFSVDELRNMGQRRLIAKTGLKRGDIPLIKRFQKGEIGLDTLKDRMKEYYRTS